MKYQMLDMKAIFASDLPSLMEGYQAVKKDGWEVIGTPLPMAMGEVGGLLQIVAKSRES